MSRQIHMEVYNSPLRGSEPRGGLLYCFLNHLFLNQLFLNYLFLHRLFLNQLFLNHLFLNHLSFPDQLFLPESVTYAWGLERSHLTMSLLS